MRASEIIAETRRSFEQITMVGTVLSPPAEVSVALVLLGTLENAAQEIEREIDELKAQPRRANRKWSGADLR